MQKIIESEFQLNQKGQGLIEYLILVALVAVSAIGVMRVVGQNIAKNYENINRALGAQKTERLKIENASEKNINKKDLSDFIEGTR